MQKQASKQKPSDNILELLKNPVAVETLQLLDKIIKTNNPQLIEKTRHLFEEVCNNKTSAGLQP